MKTPLIVGIDEAGRGALAGPVAVGMVALSPDFDFSVFPHVRDSKKLSSIQREETFEVIRTLAKEGSLIYKVSLVGQHIIDREGISRAVKKGIQRVLKLVSEDESSVYLDGLLRAPHRFESQETIVGGDDAVPVISLASIVAKVVRDRKMTQLGKVYPRYGFEIHKGYGTQLHKKRLEEAGLTEIHRRCFCKRIVVL